MDCLLKLWGVLVFIRSFELLWARKLHFEPRQPTGGKLLLVSFDGFRYDYIDKHDLKNFKKVHELGMRSAWIQDQFVTKTFPNHWTIVTGLYEESHGIISNKFYAADLGKEFNAFGRPAYKWAWDPKFWGGEPIWKTNERQGGKSGSFYWVGSEVPAMRPSHWVRYNVSYPWEGRVDQVVQWLKTPEINLATLYIDEPDHHGHMFGPSSKEVGEILKKVDAVVGYLLEQIPDDVNVIITSDHGMEDIDKDHVILIEDVVPRTTYERWYGELTHAGIWAPEERLKEIKRDLQAMNHPMLTVWERHEIPEKFHLKHNVRVPPLLLVATEPWQVARTMREVRLKGEHGYNNENMNMHPIFLAKGPQIANIPKALFKPFNSVDIYPLMCHILGVQPAPNNGTLCEISDVLKMTPNECK